MPGTTSVNAYDLVFHEFKEHSDKWLTLGNMIVLIGGRNEIHEDGWPDQPIIDAYNYYLASGCLDWHSVNGVVHARLKQRRTIDDP